MSNIIKRAEGWLATPHVPVPRHVVRDLVAELKAARAENEQLRSGYSEWENCTCPASTLFNGSVGRDCPTHGGQ